jgi:hypothetical protein
MRTLANAQSDGIVVADEPAREADQDRPEGCQPWPLRHILIGRGHGVTADVRRNLVADCPGTSLNGRGHGVTADVRRNLVADCPGTSAARTCITRPGYGRPRRQRCALTRGNLRIPALQAELPGHFARQRADCDRICFAAAPSGHKIAAHGPGICGRWEKSAGLASLSCRGPQSGCETRCTLSTDFQWLRSIASSSAPAGRTSTQPAGHRCARIRRPHATLGGV